MLFAGGFWILSPATVVWCAAFGLAHPTSHYRSVGHWDYDAFNLIDGLDGLAAGSALFSTLVVRGGNLQWFVTVSLLTIALAGEILGFCMSISIRRRSSWRLRQPVHWIYAQCRGIGGLYRRPRWLRSRSHWFPSACDSRDDAFSDASFD